MARIEKPKTFQPFTRISPTGAFGPEPTFVTSAAKGKFEPSILIFCGAAIVGYRGRLPKP
jgi:hypothetical protein